MDLQPPLEAKKLEEEFERVARDPGLSMLGKRRNLEGLLTRMFDEAIRDIGEGLNTSYIRGDYVLGFVERADLGPKTLREAFGEDNLNYRELMQIARKKSAELQGHLPQIVVRWCSPD